jgi:hypothetical protein
MKTFLLALCLLTLASHSMAYTKCTGQWQGDGSTVHLMLDERNDNLFLNGSVYKVKKEKTKRRVLYYSENYISSRGINTYVSFYYLYDTPYLSIHNATTQEFLGSTQLSCHYEA